MDVFLSNSSPTKRTTCYTSCCPAGICFSVMVCQDLWRLFFFFCFFLIHSVSSEKVTLSTDSLQQLLLQQQVRHINISASRFIQLASTHLSFTPFVLDLSPVDKAVSVAGFGYHHGSRGHAEIQRKRPTTWGLSNFTGSRHPAGRTGVSGRRDDLCLLLWQDGTTFPPCTCSLTLFCGVTQVKALKLERDQNQILLENIQQRHKMDMELMENAHK